ncbi:MAG: DNA polymerase Y family protein [Betaproteobacteria bacterium]|nr:DNA polymerase Y family protein [Betaproteobacteria bacterium]
MRWIALLFPSLPLDVFARALRPGDARAPLVVHGDGRAPRVVAANAAAREAGIRDGMPLAAALALCPGVAQVARDVAAEDAALAQLATFALTFTPAASLAEDAIVADIGPSLRLFGGEEKLVASLVGGVRERGFAVRSGLAPTPLAAVALARSGDGRRIDDGDVAAALAPLPLAHFGLDADALATLAAAGVRTFGAADRLPRGGLARRCGRAFVAALDRAAGRASDPRVPFLPPPQFAAKLELPANVHDVAALAFAVNRLVQELASWLLARGLGVTELALALSHERALARSLDSPCTHARFALAAPSRTSAHLMHVLRERLARVALPAPVAGIALATEAVAPLAGRNHALLPGGEADAPEVPLVDRLRARLGDDAVRLVVPHADHRPERAMRASSPGGGATGTPLPAAIEAPRPVWLLREPRPLAGLIEAQPWVLREGPERIESGWWDGGDVRRDYFVAESPSGEVAWIFRDHRRGTDDGEWFLHGLFG